MVLQIMVTIIAVASIARVIAQALQKRGSLVPPLMWTAVWILVIIVFWTPEVASYAAVRLGIGRGADLIVYTAILVVLYLMYRVFIRLERMEQNITSITRQFALRDPHEKKDGRRSDPEL